MQVFKKNQEGISHGEKWKVNSSGFLGHDDINGENQLLIIGDSVIENIMNPFQCRQSSIFKNKTVRFCLDLHKKSRFTRIEKEK